jgi:hypothetical protein
MTATKITASATARAGATKQTLSPSRRELVELMQRLNFGRIERLLIRDGEPVLEPKPRIVREHKFCAENGPRPELASPNCSLKSQVCDLLQLLDDVGDGYLDSLTVKNGLPFLAELPG